MLAAPTAPFDVPLWAEDPKVHPDHHIQIALALYSVPTTERVANRRRSVVDDLLVLLRRQWRTS